MEELDKNLNEQISTARAQMIVRSLLYASSKVRSLKRAFKRGRLLAGGVLKPHRPFNNRANTSKRKNVESRFCNIIKKKEYESIKRVLAKQSV